MILKGDNWYKENKIDYVIMPGGLALGEDTGGVMVILDWLVKRSFFKEIYSKLDVINKKEHLDRVPGSVNEEIKTIFRRRVS